MNFFLFTKVEFCSTEIADLSQEIHRLCGQVALHMASSVAGAFVIFGLGVIFIASGILVSGKHMQDVINETILLFTKDQTGM